MSLAWTAQELSRRPSRLVEQPSLNPRPPGVIRPGSASEAVYELLRENPERLFWRRQLIVITGRSRKSVDWALLYLGALHLIEVVPMPGEVAVGGCERLAYQRFRLASAPKVKRGRGRPPKQSGTRRTVVRMRIREDLHDKLLLLGPQWLDSCVEAAAIDACGVPS